MTDRKQYCKEYSTHRGQAKEYAKEYRKVLQLRQQLVLARQECDTALHSI